MPPTKLAPLSTARSALALAALSCLLGQLGCNHAHDPGAAAVVTVRLGAAAANSDDDVDDEPDALTSRAASSNPPPAPAPPARPPPPAEIAFQRGRALFEEGRVAEACAAFEESLAFERALATLANLAVCYERTGRTTDACRAWLDAANRAHADGQGARESYALQHRASLGCP